MNDQAPEVQLAGFAGHQAGAKPLFEERDIALLREALSLHPDLEAAAYLTKLSAPHLRFPVESPDVLIKSLRTGQCELRMRQQVWTSRDIKRFLPAALFPIENQADLLRKALIACSNGRRFHYHEEQARLCRADARQSPIENSEADPGAS